jgi:serine/threonine-protein kinase
MTDCLDDEAIANLSAGVLDEDERAALTAHIDVCDACRLLVADAAPAPAEGAASVVEPAPRRSGGATAVAEALIGETIDRKYKLVGLLGEGGMGSVYEARHTGTSRRVAVKLIRPDKLAPGSTAESRFRREARAAGAIQSPHIVEILDSGTDETTGHLYLVMEHLAGEDLKHLLDRAGRLPYEVALRIAGQALVGLAKAHAAGVVHRDIKPANLFLARQDEGAVTVKVLDFGVAKLRPDPLRGPETLGLTDTGGFLGSPVYMSPEQVQSSKDVDARADVWSLGCVLYAAITGRAPHQHVESLGRLVLAICGTPASSLRDVAPGVPDEVAAVVHRALAIERAQRTPSAAAMLESIRALLPGGLALREEMLPDRWAPAVALAEPPALRSTLLLEGSGATPPDVTTGVWTQGRRALLALAALLALGVGSTLGYLLTRPGGQVARAAPSSASLGTAEEAGPASALLVVSAHATAEPRSTPPVERALSTTATPPPSATAPRAPLPSPRASSVERPRATAGPIAPPASSQPASTDPLIPAEPP